MIKFGKLSCCLRYKLPLDWCGATRDDGNGEGVVCRYIDKAVPVALMGWRSWRLRELVQEHFGKEFEAGDFESFTRWQGQRRRFYGLRGTNLLALWEVIVWEAYKM
jgi:hypothetical protein